jgi:hypothetical protein
MAIACRMEFVFCWKLHAPWMGSLEVWVKYVFMYSLFSLLPHVCREIYWTLRHCGLSVRLISSVTTQISNLQSLKVKVKVSRDRPRWPKGFRVG